MFEKRSKKKGNGNEDIAILCFLPEALNLVLYQAGLLTTRLLRLLILTVLSRQ